MKTIKHPDYIKKKQLVIKNLPTEVQDKIAIFKEMKALEQSTATEDQPELEEELIELDMEIFADLKKLVQTYKAEKVKFRQPKPDKKVEPTTTVSDDEAILEKLYTQYKHYKIKRSTLREWGLKSPLKDITIIGKYQLKRVSFFSFIYKIQLV